MVVLPPRPQGHPIWRSPLFEWGLLAILVCAVVGVIWREARSVQMLAERAAVQSTLGALRTAYVVDFMKQTARGQTSGVRAGVTEPNPFLLLERPAVNYAGVFDASDVARVPQGSWLFDPACPCIGYRPMHPDGLRPVSDLPVLWFHISTSAGAHQLKPRADYFWAGALVS